MGSILGDWYVGDGKAMVRVGASQMEMREYPMPDVPEDAALMKVVVAGICGTDVKMYKKPQKMSRSSWATRTSGTSQRPANYSRSVRVLRR